MVTFATLLAGASLVIQVADVVPRLDVTSTCKAAIALAGNSGRTVESCVAGEEAARKEIEKDWAKFPAGERTQCIQTAAKGGSPSYVEIIVCLEMMRDSRAQGGAEGTRNATDKTDSKRKVLNAGSPAGAGRRPVLGLLIKILYKTIA
jgi:hypothetical protein